MNVQVYGEASDWIVKHRSGRLDAQERRAFDDWLRESPLHVRAYLEMSSVWENLAELDPGWNPDAETLIARAGADDGVVPFLATDGADTAAAAMATAHVARSSERQDRPDGARARRRSGPLHALAACLLVAAASLAWLHFQQEVYTTGVGEQRSLTLADGSTIALNARSRVKVKYTQDQRAIELVEGQALFQVVKNPRRPFVVQTGDVRVRAVGTAFDVRRGKSGTVVTVVEGRVAVHAVRPLADIMDSADSTDSAFRDGSPPDGKPRIAGEGEMRPAPAPVPAASVQVRPGELLLNSGEQVVVTPVAMTAPKQANVATTLAWTQRHLVLATVPLPEVAEELNRYSKRPLVIQDPALADFNVSGVFSTADTTLLLQFLRAQPELVVEETEAEIHVRRR